jgi:hypothetical protein
MPFLRFFYAEIGVVGLCVDTPPTLRLFVRWIHHPLHPKPLSQKTFKNFSKRAQSLKRHFPRKFRRWIQDSNREERFHPIPEQNSPRGSGYHPILLTSAPTPHRPTFPGCYPPTHTHTHTHTHTPRPWTNTVGRGGYLISVISNLACAADEVRLANLEIWYLRLWN